MQNVIYTNEDSRRKLIEWIEDEPFCSAKVVIVKSTVPIGGHYHKKKNESFLLLRGKAREVIIGDKKFHCVKAPFKWVVPKGVYHSFLLEKHSILLGVGDQKFDPKDEIQNDV